MATAKTDFSISANVSADTSQVQKTLNQQKFIIRADIRTNDAEKSVQRLNNLTQNTSSLFQNGFERINTTIKTGQTGFDAYGNKLQNLTKYTETFKNAIGDVQQRITVMTEKGRILSSSTQTVANGISNITTETRTATQTINGLENKITVVGKTMTDTAGNTQTVIERTREWTDASGRLNTEITTLNEHGEQLAPTITKVSDATNKASKANQNLGNSATQANKQMKGLGWTLSDAFKRLSNFYLASLPIKAFQSAITDATEIVKNFDSAITEMGKVSDYSGEQLRKYTQDLADLGTEVARTQTEMTEAATGWLKAGYSEEDAALLSKYSALLQNTADEEISAADATSVLVSQLKAYHMEANEAIKVTDIINKVSANQAVSSYDISQGLTVASAAMSTFGNSIEETTALLTAGTTIFQGRSTQVARGLNMIATRVAKNEEELKKYNVDIYNNNGQLKSTFEILQELAPAWNTMSKAEQVALGNTLAGTNQYKVFAAVMSQMDVAVESYEQALNSSGETMKQNAVYMESLEAKTTALHAEFEKLVIGEGGLQDIAKLFVELGTGALKFINSIGGLNTVIVALSGALIALKFESISKAFTNLSSILTHIIPNFKNYIGLFKYARNDGQSFSETLKTMGISASTAQLAIGALTAAVTIAVAIWSKYKQKQAELNAELEKSRQEYEQYESTLSNTLDKIQSESTTKQELIQINKNLKGSYDDEKQALIDINDLREENVKLLYQESQQKAHDYLTEHAEEAAKAEDYLNGTLKESSLLFSQMAELQLASRFPVLDDTSNSLIAVKTTLSEIINLKPEEAEQRLREEIEKLNEKEAKNGELTEAQRTAREQYTEALSKVSEKTQEVQKALEAYSNAQQVATQTEEEFIKSKVSGIEFDELTNEELNNLIEKYEIEEEEIQNLIEGQDGINYTRSEAIQLLVAEAEAQEKYQKTTKELNDTIDELADSLGITATELTVLKKKFDALTLAKFLGELAQIKQKISDTNTVIDNLQGALETASNALAEYNENGYLTIDTFQSLMGVSAQYLAALVNEKGQLEINQTTLGNLVDTLKMAKIAELAEAAAAEIAALQHTETANTAKSAQSAVDAAGDAFTRAGNKAAKASTGIALFNAELAKATGGSLGDFSGSEKAIIDKYRKLASEISTLEVNTTKAGNAAKSAGRKGAGAAKSANDAAKDLNKTLEETKSKYEKVISYITKQYDRKTKELEKAKDAATKPLEAEIKALEEEKDSVLDGIEEEINAIEKERDGIVKGIEKEIKALEKERDTIVDGVEDKIDALEDERDKFTDAIQSKIDILEDERDAFLNGIDAKIDALEEEKDKILDNIEAETTALKEQKEERQKYWDEQIDALKKANNERKDALELQEKLDALERAKNTKVKIYKEGQGFVYDVDQTKVAEAQKALDEYLSQKAYEDELERLTNLKEAELTNYSDRIDALNKFKDETQKAYETQIKNLKKYREDTSNTYKQQIEDLKEYKDGLKKSYDEQIENLKDYKDNLKKNYDTQIEDLKEYKDGLKESYDAQLDDLNEYKDGLQRNYEEQIDNLNNKKDALVEAYDEEIAMYNEYKEQFEEMVNAYQNEQDRLLAEQLTGISFENDNWMTRLDNLANFVNEYNRLQAQLNTETTSASNEASMSSGGGGGGGSYNPNTASSNRTVTNYSKPTGAINYTPNYNKKTGYVPTSVSEKIGGKSGAVKRHASGVGSVKDDEIAIVGENPNKEIIIGSKINNGELMSLNKGAGVVNADSSNTLASMLNQVGKFGSSGFGSGNGTLNNNINNDSLVVNGVTIEGSQINDPQTFVNGLLNLKAEALQRAYRHN